MSYLDLTGLTYYNSKVKALIESNLDELETSAENALEVVIDSAEWVRGGINTSGADAASNYAIRTNYHRITPYTKLYFTGVKSSNNLNRVIMAYFYDNTKTFISRDSALQVPVNANYVRFTYGWATNSGQTVENYGFANLVADWNLYSTSDFEYKIKEILKTDISKSTWEIGTISRTTGVDAAAAYQIRTDYIETYPRTTIAFNGARTDSNERQRVVIIVFYTADKTFVSGQYMSGTTPVNVPSTAIYVRFTYGYVSSAGVTLNDTSISSDFSIESLSIVDLAIKANETNIATLSDDVKYIEQRGIFTFTDDDGYSEQLSHWLDISKETGIKITEALVTNWIGQEAQAPDYPYLTPLTWDEIKQYQGVGFEFVSHSHNHLYFGGADVGTEQALTADVEASQAQLIAHNCNPEFLVYPGGRKDQSDNGIIDTVVRTHFKGAVAISEAANTVPLYTYTIFRYSILDSNNTQSVEDSNGNTRNVYLVHTLDWFKNIIDDAIANNKWVVFMSHLYNYGNYYYNNDLKNRLSEVAKYITDNGGQIMTLSDAFNIRKNRFESAPRYKNISYIVDYNGTIFDKQ